MIKYLGTFLSICLFFLESQAMLRGEELEERDHHLFLSVVSHQNTHKRDREHLLQILSREGEQYAQAKDSHGKSFLAIACHYGDDEVVNLLLQNNADPNDRGDNGVTALYVAIQGNKAPIEQYIKIIATLLEKGADPNIADQKGISPLYLSSKKGNEEMVDLLLKKGAEVNFVENTNEESPLFIAAKKGRLGALIRLINAGANVNMRNRCGITPLLIAIYENKKSAMEELLARGADPNTMAEDTTALQLATLKGHRDMVVPLIQKGAQIFYREPTPSRNATYLNYTKEGGIEREEFLLLALTAYDPLARETREEEPIYNTGRIYEMIGTSEYLKRAVSWYEYLLKINPNHKGANFRLGVLYEKGLGVGKNLDKAMEYYRAAAQLGHEVAGIRLHLYQNTVTDEGYYKLIDLKRDIQEKFLEAQEKLNAEIRQGYTIRKNPDVAYIEPADVGSGSILFNLGQDYIDCRDVLEKVLLAHCQDFLKINYDFIPVDPFLSEYNISFEGEEEEEEEIGQSAIDNLKEILKKTLVTMLEPNDKFDPVGDFEEAWGNIFWNPQDRIMKKKFMWVYCKHMEQGLKEGGLEERVKWEFALKISQNAGRCADGQSQYLDGQIAYFLRGGSEGKTVGGLISQVIQSYKQDFIEKHKDPLAEAEEKATEVPVLLRERMRFPLGLIGKFHHPTYAELGCGQKRKYSPAHVMNLFLEGGAIRFQRGRVVHHTESIEKYTPSLLVRLMVKAYQENRIKNASLQEWIEKHEKLGPIYRDAFTMMEDHAYFNVSVADGHHYFTPLFFEQLLIDHGFLIKSEV